MLKGLIDKLDYEPGTGHFINCSYTEAAVYARYGESAVNAFTLATDELIFLEDKLGRYHHTTGDLSKALFHYEEYNRLEKELYEGYPQNVGFKNGLAVSYSKLGIFYYNKGDKQRAVMYLEAAQRIWEELTTDFPNYHEFKKNLAWVKNILDNLGKEEE